MAEINVTPLVDVMLVLLIIFMVTAPLLVTGVPVELPESRANALDQKSEPVEIAIDKRRRDLHRRHRGVAVRTCLRGSKRLPPRKIRTIRSQIMLRGDTVRSAMAR